LNDSSVLGLGFDDEVPKARKVDTEQDENKPAKSIMDSLLGKSSDVNKHLERPGSSEGKKEFVLDKKYMKKEGKLLGDKKSDLIRATFGWQLPHVMLTSSLNTNIIISNLKK
jgi:hypothetical protein